MKAPWPEAPAMYDRVVVAVDGSEAAERAARRGIGFAATFGAEVDVVHVLERKRRRLVRSEDEEAELRERGERILEDVAELASQAGVTVSTHLASGEPAAAIREHAADRDASVIVLGRQGLSGLGDRLFGGTTERVLQSAEVPVLVVPRDGDADVGAYERVLVPTDGSANAESAGIHGAAVASHSGATLHVLNVVDLQSAGGVFDAGGLDRSFVERLEEQGREAVDQLAARIDEASPAVAVETEVARFTEFDGVAGGVREYVETNGVDLVVIGSHGRSNLKRQLLGSVATGLVGKLDVPVLVVPRDESS